MRVTGQGGSAAKLEILLQTLVQGLDGVVHGLGTALEDLTAQLLVSARRAAKQVSKSRIYLGHDTMSFLKKCRSLIG